MRFRRPSPNEVVALLAFAFLFYVAMVKSCSAEPITFYVCDNPTFKRNGDALEVRCPGKAEPVLKVFGCEGPKVVRNDQRYTLTCTNWKPYKQVPA